jgi:hypothetical protein
MAMTIEAFERSLAGASPPEGYDLALQALWWAGKGDWSKAHGCAQQDEGNPRCDHVHAYLHREEGDIGNARYWYRRAGQSEGAGPLPDEWKAILRRMLSES